MLKYTPLGTSMEDVIEFVENNGRGSDVTVRDVGFARRESGEERRIGERSIRFCYTGRVRIYYGFDENDELIEIWVTRWGSWP
jgi:hypothetical protein